MTTVTLSNGRQFSADSGTTLLDAALQSAVVLEHSCRTGRCGSCKALVLAGESAPLRDEISLTAAEAASGWILTCAREARSDLALDIEDLSALDGISSKTLPCRVDSLDVVAADAVKVQLRLPPNAGFVFRAGQYLDMIGPRGIKRSYSIASSPCDASKLELHIRRVENGDMSRYWFEQAQSNDLLRLRGPLGTFFLRDVAGIDLVFLATGTGIAPIKSMLTELTTLSIDRRPASVALYWGGRVPQDIYWDPRDTMPDLNFVPVLSRADAGWTGARGYVQDALLRNASQFEGMAVYACGSKAMIDSAREALAVAGLVAKHFHSDAFVSSN